MAAKKKDDKATAKEAASKTTIQQVKFAAFWVVLLFILFQFFGAFKPVDQKWGDFIYRTRGVTAPKIPAVLVTIDNKSIEKIGQYPWPRSTYARLVDSLKFYGAKTIAFDVIFSDPSPSKADDEAFARAVKRAGNVVLAGWLSQGIQSGSFKIKWPFEQLRKSAAGLGYVNVQQDSDGQVRYVNAFQIVDDVRLPLLGLAALAHWSGKAVETYYKELEATEGMVVINLNGEVHEEGYQNQAGQRKTVEDYEGLDAEEQKKWFPMMREDYAFKHFPAISIINRELDKDDMALLKGALVLVGSTATGAYDHYPSPFYERMPGVLVHMTLADNLVSGRELRIPPLLLVIFASLVMAVLAVAYVRVSPLTGAIASLSTTLAWSWLCYFMFLRNYRFDWALPAIAHASLFVILIVQKALAEQKEKRWIKNTFGQYLSPKVVEILVNDPSKLTLGGEKRDLTVFFLDIAHFTNISEKMDPEKLTAFLNTYLTALTDVIMKHEGVVDKYIGDCIMAFWNAPLDDPKHRLHACLSAVECIETIARLNDTVLPKDVPERPDVRIGLNSGFAVVGNMGSNMRFSYTVIGDEVNLSSRLEGANKFFGSHIMASEATYKGQAEEVLAARPLGRVKVIGKEIPILVYELMGEKGKLPEHKQKLLDAYLEGIEKYLKRDFDGAQKAFKRCLELMPGDGPSKLYLRQSQDFAAVPPQKDWDGVWSLTSK